MPTGKNKKIFVRVCKKKVTEDFSAIRDIVYEQRYGVAFKDDNRPEGNARRAYKFEHKELNALDDCILFFATRAEISKLKEKNYPVQAFNMNQWVEL